jgi:hypothetical protein
VCLRIDIVHKTRPRGFARVDALEPARYYCSDSGLRASPRSGAPAVPVGRLGRARSDTRRVDRSPAATPMISSMSDEGSEVDCAGREDIGT